MTEKIGSTFQNSIEEGEQRLSRRWAALFATGAVGGIDVGIGVFGLIIVHEATGSPLLAGLAFGIGFIALALANSELFTENFLVPIAAVAAGRARPLAVVRLWGGTAVTNLLGGWVLMAVVMLGFPKLRPTAVELAEHYVDMGIGSEAFATAVLGGTVITLMTWMQRGADSMATQLVAAVAAAFLLGAGPLNHAIVVSLVMFAGLQAGAPFGYLDWLGVLGWATVGNIVGGVGLVTVLRLVQVGKDRLVEEREAAGSGDVSVDEGEREPLGSSRR